MFQFTLWDIFEPLKRAVLGESKPKVAARARPVAKRAKPAKRTKQEQEKIGKDTGRRPVPRDGEVETLRVRKPRAGRSMQQRYDDTVVEMLAKYQVRVRKWRTTSSGVAWETTYTDGTKKRMLESPRPRGPMSIAIFLHEIGHHHIGLGAISPRCLEEYHAWMFALAEMRKRGLPITERVEMRVHASLRYAVGKAMRRGIREIPEELRPYMGRRAG